jgi:ATP-dependent helicase/nuclease subunit A
VVLDFKSDDVNDESILVERYNSQLLLYKKAIEGIFKGKKVKRVIYSFKLNKAIWLD